MREQRIDASVQRPDHWADAMPVEQPAPAAGWIIFNGGGRSSI
jgi:hypothetical protein